MNRTIERDELVIYKMRKLSVITPQLSEDEIRDCPWKKNIIAGLLSLSVYLSLYLSQFGDSPKMDPRTD